MIGAEIGSLCGLRLNSNGSERSIGCRAKEMPDGILRSAEFSCILRGGCGGRSPEEQSGSRKPLECLRKTVSYFLHEWQAEITAGN